MGFAANGFAKTLLASGLLKTPGTALAPLRVWKALHRLPGGRRLFTRWVGRVAPYSGSIDAVVVELEPGHARVRLAENRRHMNHLNSVHAIALANVAELASGLAMVSALPRGTRGIVVKFSVEYRHKARGVLTAECDFDPPSAEELANDLERDVPVRVLDRERRLVAEAVARWRVGPQEHASRGPEKAAETE